MVRELRNRMSHASLQFHSRLRILLSIRENNQINDLKLIKFSFDELLMFENLSFE